MDPINWDNPKVNKTARTKIPYLELPGYGEQFIDDGSQSTRRLACRWYERQAFMLDVLGYTSVVGSGSSKKLRRFLPEKQPSFQGVDVGIATMWAQDMTLVGGGGWFGQDDDGALAYHASSTIELVGGSGADQYDVKRDENEQGVAIYEVTYRPVLYNLIDDATLGSASEMTRYVIKTYEPCGENYEFPRGMLTFSQGPPYQQVYSLPPVLFPGAIYNLLWVQVPFGSLPELTMFGTFDETLRGGNGDFVQGGMGSVNDAPFLGKPKETMLCLAPRIRTYQSKTTDIYHDVLFSFQYKPQTHQRFILPNSSIPPTDATWDRLRRSYGTGAATTQDSVFLKFSFPKMFDVSQP